MGADGNGKPSGSSTGVGKNIFLTGATGFLGAEIMKRVLEAHPASRLTVLVRSSPTEMAGTRVDKLLARTFGADEGKRHRARVDVVDGDISRPGLGLDATQTDAVRSSVDHVVHCAATVRFDLPYEVARRDNTEGTRHVLALADGARSLRRLDYIGTSYVAGGREGLVLEDELYVGQNFSNSYERTKMEAETLVREFAKRHPTSIHRPSIVVGDSKTGATTSFEGMYQTVSMFKAAYSRGVRVALPADPKTKVDIVPIDYVVDALFALIDSPKAIGRAHHLTSGPGYTCELDELIAIASRLVQVKQPPYMSLDTYLNYFRPVLRAVIWGKKRKLMLKGEHYMPYGSTKFEFDKTNTYAGLEGTGITTPHPRDYFEKLLTFQAKKDQRLEG
jgi:thioester reductase-like protein